ncbi:MAG: lysoplasmalogenase [Corallococcus sp.]|nr:lysoplasmalogenase [Corallococcus sp.]
MAFRIAVIVTYALLTATLIILKGFKIGRRRRGVFKMITAALYVAVSSYGFATGKQQYGYVLIIGLCFAFLGDFFLIFMRNRKMFVTGVLSFSAASVTLTVYAILSYGWQWWALIPFAAFTAVNIVCQAKNVYSYGQNIAYLNVYTVCVGLCGSLGLTLLCSSLSANTALFGLGCFMYLVSDVLLGLYFFKFNNRVVDMLNTLMYFPGMLLIAFSLLI